VAGHYTAYIKYRETGKWYCFDDDDVREVNESDLVTNKAYVLFYVRKDVNWTSLNELYLISDDSEETDDVMPEYHNYNNPEENNPDRFNEYNSAGFSDEINLNDDKGWAT